MKAHTLIKRALERQQKIHAGLSLRSLAERSRVSPGFLSKVLSGKKDLSFELAEKLFKHLHMDALQKDQVLKAMQTSLLKKRFKAETLTRGERTVRQTRASVLSEFVLMETDAEWLLAKWYRLSLLDLVTCADFQEDPHWVSSRLSLTVSDAGTALKELEKYGFLKRDENGKLRKVHENLRFPTKFSKSVVRDYHVSQMKRAVSELTKKIDQESYERRLITSVGVASNPKSLEKAKAILHEALYEAAAALSEGPVTEVYQINLQLFPQTTSRKTKI